MLKEVSLDSINKYIKNFEKEKTLLGTKNKKIIKTEENSEALGFIYEDIITNLIDEERKELVFNDQILFLKKQDKYYAFEFDYYYIKRLIY